MSALRRTLLFCVPFFSALAISGEEPAPRPFDLSDEVVCRVNTEAISKRQVEERMEEIAFRLYAWRKSQEDAGQWTADAEKKFNELYIPPFRDALRRVVRERLILQAAKTEKMPFDDRGFEKRVAETTDRLKKEGLMGSKGFTVAEVQKRVKDNMTLDTYRFQFANFLDYPTRPEVTKQYNENLSRYQRKAGVKVRLIRVDRFVSNKLTGKQTLNPNALEQATKLREDIVSFQGDFEQVAKLHNDDEELRSRGGLILLNPKDPFFEPDGYNVQLANAIRNLQPKDVSAVFELGQTSWAFAQLVERREAGPAPLEGDLYEDIYHQLFQQKTRKKEDEWFRKALKKSLVVQVVSGKYDPLPVSFFFPEEHENKPTAEGSEPKKSAIAKEN